MKLSDLTATETDFMRKLHEAEDCNPAAYIGTLALLCSMAGSDIPQIPEQYSHAALKRAIRHARELQKEHPEFQTEIEDSIAFIRYNWLHNGK